MQRLADTVLGNAKESIKTFTQESFQNTVRVINGFSALVLAFLPGMGPTFDGIELHPTFRAPRMPQWLEEGASSFNTFLTDYDAGSESSSGSESESGVEDTADQHDSTRDPSPALESTRLSRAGSSGRRHRRNKSLLQHLLLWMLWPLRLLFRLWPSGNAEPRRSSSGGLRGLARRLSGREFTVPKSAADRRRGILEDLELVMDIFIERVFDVVHKIVHLFLSPFKTLGEFFHRAFFRDTSYNDDTDTADMATLGDSHPHPQKQKQVPQQPLNTDSRTCQDIITSLGYPYEAHRVTTDDGHVLLLERIPRRESRKAVILQHGVLDSSLSWVSNGVVGSQAFAAFDQGYDVYLGNLRGLASREHVDKHISPKKYWNFSINEHGIQDISAMIRKIHELKMLELQGPKVHNSGTGVDGESKASVDYDPNDLPYRLCGVAHSLGGAAMLMYVVTKRLANQPHYLSRLILLSPAGFHGDAPLSVKLAQYVVPLVANFLYLFTPGIYIPTRFFRGLFNKLSRDFQNYPALGGLAQALLSYLIGGDSSNWVGAIGLSHYNMNNMPGVSVKVAVHFSQMARTKRFIMYDHGTQELNRQAYGTPYPLDLGANYNVIDIPVDVVAGHRDKLIPPTMVKQHFDTMESAGCQASYSEFEFAHLDFTFANREELMAYVTSRLSLVAPVPGKIIQPLEETSSSQKLTGSLSERRSVGGRRLNGETLRGVSRNGEILEEVPETKPAESSPSTSKLKST